MLERGWRAFECYIGVWHFAQYGSILRNSHSRSRSLSYGWICAQWQGVVTVSVEGDYATPCVEDGDGSFYNMSCVLDISHCTNFTGGTWEYSFLGAQIAKAVVLLITAHVALWIGETCISCKMYGFHQAVTWGQKRVFSPGWRLDPGSWKEGLIGAILLWKG